MIQRLRRFFKPVSWHNLRNTKPVSNVFGFDRGTPIDRYYIEKFLEAHKSLIKGDVLEIASDEYSAMFGSGITKQHILHYDTSNPKATIVGDLSNPSSLPGGTIDCFICTQTFNFIYDFKRAIQGAHHVLKKDGVLLATLAGLCQVSRYDMDRWGDFWRFTTKSAEEAFGEVFGKENVTVACYGNVLAATSLLHGISIEELTEKELDLVDADYQVIITVIARK